MSQQITRLQWDKFKQIVQHQKRYFFHHEHIDGEGNLYADTLVDQIGNDLCDSSHTIPAGESFYRCRANPDDYEGGNIVLEIGPPPPILASENRMSPEGISMLYMADSIETAIWEVAYLDGDFGVGKFESKEEITVLDLFDLSKIKNAEMRYFMKSFVDDVTKPISKDNRRHIEYVPTQIFTEILTRNWSDGKNNSIRGSRFPSSKDPTSCSYVFFYDHDDFHKNSHPFKFVDFNAYGVFLKPLFRPR